MNEAQTNSLYMGLCCVMLAILAITVLYRLKQGWTGADFLTALRTEDAKPVMAEVKRRRQLQQDLAQQRARARQRAWEAQNAPTDEIPVVVCEEASEY